MRYFYITVRINFDSFSANYKSSLQIFPAWKYAGISAFRGHDPCAWENALQGENHRLPNQSEVELIRLINQLVVNFNSLFLRWKTAAAIFSLPFSFCFQCDHWQIAIEASGSRKMTALILYDDSGIHFLSFPFLHLPAIFVYSFNFTFPFSYSP